MKVKGIFGVLAAFAGIGIFVGMILTDYAKKPFWWNFWEVFAVICFAAFVGGFFWLKANGGSSSEGPK